MAARAAAAKRHPSRTLPYLAALLLLASLLFLFAAPRSSLTGTVGRSSAASQFQNPPRSCNYSDGAWIRSPGPVTPGYDSTCKEIFKGWKCTDKSNRRDLIQWRWQPSGCSLPPFDPLRFLHRFRDTNIGFVGDSLNRNMFVSLICTLRKAAKGEVRKWRPAGSDRGFTFSSYNLTVAYHRTNLLVRYDMRGFRRFTGLSQPSAHPSSRSASDGGSSSDGRLEN